MFCLTGSCLCILVFQPGYGEREGREAGKETVAGKEGQGRGEVVSRVSQEHIIIWEQYCFSLQPSLILPKVDQSS